MPLQFTFRPYEHDHSELFIERLEGKTIAHSVPAFYVDGGGNKKPVDFTLRDGTDAGRGTIYCRTNSLRTTGRDDGNMRIECADGVINYRLVGEERTKPGPPERILERLSPPGITGFTKAGRVISQARGDIKIDTEILHGKIKDTIEIAQLPNGSDATAPYAVIFGYSSSTLEPVMVNGAVHWMAEEDVSLLWVAPVGWDADGTTIPLEYSIDTVAKEITLSTVGAVDGYTFPLYFDPTTTISHLTGDANRLVVARDNLGSGDNEDRHTTFLDMDAVSLGGDTLTDAKAFIYANNSGGGSADLTGIEVYCEDQSTTGLSAAQLGALSTGTAVSTGGTLGTSAAGYREFNIFGSAGSSGAAKVYNDGGTNLNTRIFWSNAPEQTFDSTDDSFPDFGEIATGAVTWTSLTNGTNYPYVELTHAAAGGSESATGAITFPSFAVAGEARSSFHANGAITFPSFSVSGQATRLWSATGAITFPSFAVSGTASRVWSATGAITFPSFAVSGTVYKGSTVEGAITFPSFTVSGAVERTVPSTGAITFPSFTVSGSVDVPRKEVNGAITFPSFQVSGSTVQRNRSGFLIVERFSATDLAGVEDVSLFDTYSNALGGTDFTEAESAAGTSHYSGMVIWNQHPTETATDVRVWLDPDAGAFAGIQIAKEALVGGAVQTIANEATSPAALSWVSPTTYETGLVIGSIAPGAGYGIWREITVGAGAAASPRELVALRYSLTLEGEAYEQAMRGVFRIAATQATPWAMYEGEDVVPVVGTDIPIDTSADGNFAKAKVLTEATWNYVFSFTDKFGLESQASDTQTLYIDSGGTETNGPPIAPDTYSITAGADGTASITAIYIPVQEPDIDNRATSWAIFATFDGTTPDPDVDSPIATQAMFAATGFNPEQLLYTTAAQIDNAPIQVIVRTRRTDAGPVTFDSINTDIVSTTATKKGPARMRGEQSYGRARGLFNPSEHADSETIYIDQPNNIRFVLLDSSVSFYMGTELIWRRLSDGETQTLYIPTEYAIEHDAVSGAGTSDVVEAVSATLVYLNANGTRCVEVDKTAKTIKATAWTFNEEALEDIAKDTPTWARFADSLFSVFDLDAQNYEVYLKVEAGRATVAPNFNHTKAQVAIEAL